jgi:ribosomal protein S27E
MSLHKTYRADGTPDLASWTASCDVPNCTATTLLLGSATWIIPDSETMPIYCPACWSAIADFLIGTAIRCVNCGCVYLTPYLNPHAGNPHARPDQRWPHHIDCNDCGHINLLYDHYQYGDQS